MSSVVYKRRCNTAVNVPLSQLLGNQGCPYIWIWGIEKIVLSIILVVIYSLTKENQKYFNLKTRYYKLLQIKFLVTDGDK